MAKDIRVTLVFDPFGIWAESADFVRDVRDELEAFRQIEDLLRRDDRFETVTPKTFLVHPECWEHLQGYRGVCGVTLDERLDPASFATRWLRRRGLRPLADVSAQNPLRAPGIHVGSPQQRALARYIPLVFPLPSALHAEISGLTRQAVHNARIENPEAFKRGVLRLEAWWPGLAEELKMWVAMHPRAMSRAAADHLRGLPGFEEDDLARRLVHEYAPAEGPPAWPGHVSRSPHRSLYAAGTDRRRYGSSVRRRVCVGTSRRFSFDRKDGQRRR